MTKTRIVFVPKTKLGIHCLKTNCPFVGRSGIVVRRSDCRHRVDKWLLLGDLVEHELSSRQGQNFVCEQTRRFVVTIFVKIGRVLRLWFCSPQLVSENFWLVSFVMQCGGMSDNPRASSHCWNIRQAQKPVCWHNSSLRHLEAVIPSSRGFQSRKVKHRNSEKITLTWLTALWLWSCRTFLSVQTEMHVSSQLPVSGGLSIGHDSLLWTVFPLSWRIPCLKFHRGIQWPFSVMTPPIH